MSTNHTPTLADDIERGMQIRAEIERLNAELKEVEARILAVAKQARHVPLKEEDREGKKFDAKSPRHVVPVIFESDLLAASFLPDSDRHKALKKIAGDKLPLFFKPVHKFERVQDDGREFRRDARANLEPDQFAEFIKACLDLKKGGIPKSRILVAWKEAEAAQPAA